MTTTYKKLSLWLLAWPIMIEMLLQFMIGTVDTLMVSRISDDAVAVVGISNQFFQAVIILFTVISSGAGIVIAQKIGAQREAEARNVATMALLFTLALGLILSVVLYCYSDYAARLMQVPEPLLPMAEQYLGIVGSNVVFMALILTMNTIIRNTGNTKGPMYIAVGMNIIHIIGNYGFIFGKLGFPQLGLEGVAYSTVGSRIIAFIVLMRLVQHAFGTPLRLREFRQFSTGLIKQVVRVGWPLSVHAGTWTFSQLFIFSLVATMGSLELATRTYMNTLESFSFLCGFSVAMAVQIQIGQLYGAKRYDDAYKSAYRALALGMSIVVANTLLLVLLGGRVVEWFTDNPDIISLAVSLIALNLLLQPGKMVNMAFGNSISAIGDTRFLMMNSMCSMWLVAAGLSYVLGIRMGWGLYGVYAAMITDEYVRGLILFLRWRSRARLGGRKRISPNSEATTMSS